MPDASALISLQLHRLLDGLLVFQALAMLIRSDSISLISKGMRYPELGEDGAPRDLRARDWKPRVNHKRPTRGTLVILVPH